VADILEDVSFLPNNGLYNIERAENAPIEDSKENCPVLKSLGFEAASVDVITHRTQWPVEKVLARLLDLELEDKVARTAEGYIKLARG
jgi:DNA processing protein